MFDGTNTLVAATLAFVGGHFLLSSRPLRPLLQQRYGDRGFRILYSLAMLAAFIWMVASYRGAPFTPLWELPAIFAWVPTWRSRMKIRSTSQFC